MALSLEAGSWRFGLAILALGACTVSDPNLQTMTDPSATPSLPTRSPSSGSAATDNAAGESVGSGAPTVEADIAADDAAVSPSDAPIAAGLRTACDAPSLAMRRPIDARDEAALAHCALGEEPERRGNPLCGKGSPGRYAPTNTTRPLRAADRARLAESVLAFDAATIAHLSAIGVRGKSLGRKPRAFGLVGDSITVGPMFLGPFSEGSRFRSALAPDVVEALPGDLTLDDQRRGNVIDYFRGIDAEGGRDSFGARRAAKVGVRAGWALFPEDKSPLDAMVASISPSIAVVLFGTNDAAYRVGSLESIATAFEADLERLVDALEQRGIVPILSTVPRHGDQPGRPLCDRYDGDASDWRVAVQTNVVSAAAARVACRKHLPLVDLRHAMDGLADYGLSSDGVHPNAFRGGAGMLTAEGLQCGYNVRNYVTLAMLQRVVAELQR